MADSSLSENLVYASDEHFDIERVADGERFVYRRVTGDVIEDKKLLDAIEALVIPPNWQNVKITSSDRCHIRAYGYDDARRKQYIYHPHYLELRNQKKFDRLVEFAQALPTIRKVAHKDLEREKWDKRKVLGLIALTLDETYMRVGNAQYLKRNETYGLTTLRRKHLEIDESALVFEYKGKSNKYRKVRVDNRQLTNLITKSSELPGYEIFRYRSEGKFHGIDSSDVNAYLQEVTGQELTSKDFRTWGGTVLSIELLPEAERIVEDNPRKKLHTTLVQLVAKRLGNTVAVCRDYYIHPAVLALVEEGKPEQLYYTESDDASESALSASEKKALEVIQGQ